MKVKTQKVGLQERDVGLRCAYVRRGTGGNVATTVVPLFFRQLQPFTSFLPYGCELDWTGRDRT